MSGQAQKGIDMNTHFIAKILTLLAVITVTFTAYAQTSTSDILSELPESHDQAQQSFVSNKVVTTNCGDIYRGFLMLPGFAEVDGGELRDMPPPIAQRVAVGANRELVPTDYDQVSSGYVLIEPLDTQQSFLINNEKEIVATIEGDYYPIYTQILDNGNRLVTSFSHTDVFPSAGGAGGCVEEVSAKGDLLWRVNLNTDKYIQHHDVIKLENGNILAMIWELATAEEAIALGRDPDLVAENGTFWWDSIIEVNPHTLEVVWEWSVKNHLIQDLDPTKPNYGVVADHPERININKVHMSGGQTKINPDWLHTNAFDYHPDLDQIMISSNFLSEVWFIDHSTTTTESMASEGGRYGKGGDLIYRWGNPGNYDKDTEADRISYNQHDIQWILPGLPGAGNILIFNNGDPQLRPYTTVIEFTPNMNADGSYNLTENGSYDPGEMIWEYDPAPPEQFFSWLVSGAQRLPNGNTLINHGAGGHVREVNPKGQIVWDYSFKNHVDAPHTVFRVYRYEEDHPGLVHLLSQ